MIGEGRWCAKDPGQEGARTVLRAGLGHGICPLGHPVMLQCVCAAAGVRGQVGTGHVVHAPSAQWSTTQPFRQGDWGPLRETWKSVKIHAGGKK